MGSYGRDWGLFCVTMTTFLINKATFMVSLEDTDSLEDYH